MKAHVDPFTGEVIEARVGNALIIPIRNGRGEIVSLQGIFAYETTGGSNKEFLRGGQKAGCFFRIGPPTTDESTSVIVICEGYATGASIYEATGATVLVAFDAGNLGRVAKVVRTAKPAIRIVLAADDDRATSGHRVYRRREARPATSKASYGRRNSRTASRGRISTTYMCAKGFMPSGTSFWAL